MPSKKERHKIILELLKQYSLKTQDEISEKLLACGYLYSQATISRDLKDLNIVKDVYGKRMCYTTLDQIRNQFAEPTMGDPLRRSIKNSIVSVYSANSIVLVETMPGLANAVGVYIDSIKSEKVLGCVARRNKVIIVLRNNETANAFRRMLETK